MRAISIYLKILLSSYSVLLLACSHLTSGAPADIFTTAANQMLKRILRMRTLPFEDCGSKYDVLYLNISSCATIPCEMNRGSDVMVNVIFDDNGDETKYLKHRVRWIFNSVKTDAEITPDKCDGDDQCLRSENEDKLYWAKVIVDSDLPMIRGTMLWEAVDERGHEVICFKVPVAIVPGLF